MLPDIHLSVDAAELYAQVFPTLVIALLLEGKLKLSDFPLLPFLTIALDVIRAIAVMTGSLATIYCLYLVGANEDSGPLGDSLAILALASAGVSFLMFAIKFLTSEDGPLTEYLEKRGSITWLVSRQERARTRDKAKPTQRN